MMGFDNPLTDGQPQAGAFRGEGSCGISSVKPIKNPRLIFRGNSNSMIYHRQLRLIP